MNQSLKKALEHADYVTTFKNQKRVLLEKYNKDCIVYYCGGQFTATRELIVSLMTIDCDIFVDNNSTPIEIISKGEFHNTLETAFIKANQSYYKEYQKIIKSERTVQGIINV